MNPGDFIGQRFGMLTVMEDSGQRKGNSILWRCRCDCGGEILAVRRQLVSGNRSSCGCIPDSARSKVTDMIGQRFGRLTVKEDSGKRSPSGEILWRCQCDCGGEIFVVRKKLISGHTTDCGCLPRERVPRTQAEDLTGRRFGELTAIRRVENDKNGKTCWLCKCSCGRESVVQALRLKSGHTRSCGCQRHRQTYNQSDLAGQRFGRLTVLYQVKEKNALQKTVWHCRCDCGKETDVFAGSLISGATTSCGCWNKEQSASMHEHMHYQNDTCIEVLKRIPGLEIKNKAGFRGLFLTKSGKYRAAITFQKKHYNLGYFQHFQDAVQARLDAEEVLQAGYIKAFERYEKRAKAEPAWAERNPFYFHVTRQNGEFQVQTNG